MALSQRILGRNYKWWYLLIYSFKTSTTYRWNSLFWLLSSVVIVMATLVIWNVSLSNGTGPGTFSEMFTYLIVAEIFIFNNMVQFDIGEEIQNGKISSRLILPVHPLKYYVVRSFGYQFFENSTKSFIYFFIAVFFGIIVNRNLYIPDSGDFIIFLVFVGLAWVINACISILIGLGAFFLTAFFGLESFISNLRLVLSGRFFPLNLTSYTQFLKYLPFSFTFFHPMQIYLGKYDSAQKLSLFMATWGWCLVLYVLVMVTYRFGLKRNESIGL